MRLNELDHPFAAAIADYLRQIENIAAPTSPKTSRRAAYLSALERIVRFFCKHQDDQGAIIDPVFQREWHYSTPCFALAAALLSSEGKNEFLAHAEQAMIHASASLASGNAPDNHPDFFTVVLVTADELLAGISSPDRRAIWQTFLKAISPSRVYRMYKGRIADDHIHNWNLINITGEYLRHRAGLGGTPEWWEDHLPFHTRRLTEFGLYRDGPLSGAAHPFAYDAIARYHLSLMMQAGYDGPLAGEIRRGLLRGAITSLLVQSPVGEWPGVGRSAHHLWNDAALAATYEWAAGALRETEPILAGACARGARLAFEAILPWERSGGDFSIVRNHFEPEDRHGFEHYSIHTTYNLWTAAALAFAHYMAAEKVTEQWLPSEAAAYAVDLGRDFHQVAAANCGYYILIDTCADLTANPTGMVRINRMSCNGQIGPSEGAVKAPRYACLGETGALSHAPAWQDALGDWHTLAAFGSAHGALAPKAKSASFVDGDDLVVTIAWRGGLAGCRIVEATYRLGPERVQIHYRFEGPERVRAEIPLFEFDGEERSKITVHEDLTVSFRGSRLRIKPLGSGVVHLTNQRASTRTGVLRRAYIESGTAEVGYEIEIAPLEARYRTRG